MTLRLDEVEEVLEWIEDHGQSKLSDWEMQFMESVREQWDERKSLSPKQLDVLDKIFERVK